MDKDKREISGLRVSDENEDLEDKNGRISKFEDTLLQTRRQEVSLPDVAMNNDEMCLS